MTQPDAPQEHRGRQTALTISLLGGALAVAFEAYGTVTAMPQAATDLGRIELYAWAFTAFIIGQVLAIVLAGRIVDRIGPVLPLAIGVGVFVVGLLGAGFAPSMLWLLIWRFVQGVGAGALNLSFMVVVAQAYGKAERAWLMTMLSFCWMLPGFVGPPLAAWVTTTFGWHWVFLGMVPALLLVMAVGAGPMLHLHRTRDAGPRPETNPVPIWAAFAAAAGAAALQFAGQVLGTTGIIAAIVGAVVLLLGLPQLMPDGFLRLARGMSSVMLTRGLASGAFFAAESFVPLLLIEMHGFTLGQAGIFLAVGSTGWTLGSVIQAWRGLRIRRDQIIHLGALSLVIGLLVTAVAAALQWHWLLVVLGFTFGGLGMGLLVSSTSLSNMQLSEPQLIGRNTSSLQVAEGLGNALITGLAGAIFASLHLATDPSGTFTPIYLMATVFAGLALVTALRIGPVRNESAGVG